MTLRPAVKESIAESLLPAFEYHQFARVYPRHAGESLLVTDLSPRS